jgi:hypothetical protein
MSFPGTDNGRTDEQQAAIDLGRLLEAHAIEFLRYHATVPKATDGQARAAADSLYIKDITILRHALGMTGAW